MVRAFPSFLFFSPPPQNSFPKKKRPQKKREKEKSDGVEGRSGGRAVGRENGLRGSGFSGMGPAPLSGRKRKKKEKGKERNKEWNGRKNTSEKCGMRSAEYGKDGRRRKGEEDKREQKRRQF